MLPVTRRLPRSLFTSYFTTGKRSHSPVFTLIHTPTTSPFRAAVVVSKKVAKRAVDRNRLRRRAYSVVAKMFPPTTTGVYIVLYKPGALKHSRLALAAELGDLLARSGKAR